ncbi:SIMPL domain-containing protein [Marinifilum fragile]|uniref:SIMPL domain-containing protein n=1 Tax=Marinifilum fragile TaxID=570161 RepID=UPI002AA6A9A5|nr:SIMPL domain-containing protein [Marinifilum fragile]
MKFRILILAVILSCTLSSAAQTINGNYLKIKGQAILHQIPELMILSIPLESEDLNYEECSNKLVESYNLLIEGLTSIGVKPEEIKTGRLNVSEKFFWRDGEIDQNGFEGKINLKIILKENKEMVNKIISTLKKDDFNFGYNLSFDLSDEQKLQLRDEAIKRALKDAEHKANIISTTMGVGLVEIKEINYGYKEGRFDDLVYEEELFFDADMKIKKQTSDYIRMNPDNIKIKKSISVIWRIEKIK